MAAAPSRLEDLKASFSGIVLLPGDSGYDEARRIHNGLIDKRPAVIALCQNTPDIRDAINFGRESDLEISVRGGGHNPAGLAVAEGGLMIDLSTMKGIHVDPAGRTAHAQPGVIWNEFNRATGLHGLAVTGGQISTTGIAGLTLGGGLGWVMSSYGMAVDNVLSVEIVTADGEVQRASKDENPDLFWAVRGGGGNFGVVSWFEYRLHPLTMVTGGLVTHPFPDAGDMLRFYRDFTTDVGDDLTVFAGIMPALDGSGVKLGAMLMCHVGPPDKAQADLEPILSFGQPVMVEVGPIPYPVMNTILDDAFPSGALNYWKSSFLSGVTDDAIATMVEHSATCPSPMTGVLLEHFHGEVTRVDPTATAFPHRERSYNFLIFGQWMDPTTTEDNILWVKETYAAMESHFGGGRYVNYLSDDEADGSVQDAYGVVYNRLRELKQRYDPHNLFHLNQNIHPTG
ncbi:MAG: FAD-binding oxidoreductase [Actinobacteria bacterium]|nr:FAD-binding oxidoreductase [Actinomycetota bacterium]